MTPLIGLLVILQTNPVEPAAWSPHEFDSVEAACSVLWEMGAVEPKEEERPTLFVEEDERPDDAVVIDLDEIWNSYDRSWQTRVMGERDRPKVWPLSYRPLPEDRIAALHSLSEESVPIWTQIVRGSRSQRFFFSPPWQDLAFRLDGLARALGWIRAREALAERDADGVAESSRVVFDWATRLMVFPAWGWIMYMGSTPLDTRVEARRMRVLAVPHLPAPPQWTTSPTSDEDTLREFYGHRILSDAGTGSSLAKA
ncbi:MAG: hypothetical protein KDC38_20295, partial [Planctomycetes bacterium]|nr:hypothetical protein [Planctomycetota bacterium]